MCSRGGCEKKQQDAMRAASPQVRNSNLEHQDTTRVFWVVAGGCVAVRRKSVAEYIRFRIRRNRKFLLRSISQM